MTASPLDGHGSVVCARCAQQLWQPIAAAQLPDLLTEPTVTVALFQLQAFRDRLAELLAFAADVTGVAEREVATWDLEKWRVRQGLPCRDPLFRYWQLGGR